MGHDSLTPVLLSQRHFGLNCNQNSKTTCYLELRLKKLKNRNERKKMGTMKYEIIEQYLLQFISDHKYAKRKKQNPGKAGIRNILLRQQIYIKVF